jgi:hypothetical protein
MLIFFRQEFCNLLFLLFVQFFLVTSLSAYPLPLKSNSIWKTCISQKNFSFSFSSNLFKNSNLSAKKLEEASKILAQERYTQAICLKNLSLSSKEKELLSLELEKLQELEQELLGYSENFWNYQEEKLHFNYLESKILKEYFLSKRQIYNLLFRRTMEVIFSEITQINLETFQNIYLSSLKLEYQMLSNLRPEIREIILTQIFGSEKSN